MLLNPAFDAEVDSRTSARRIRVSRHSDPKNDCPSPDMLEIFALPYFVVSGVIGWAVFGPFIRIEDSEALSRADIAISDLLAVSLPVGVVFASACWMMPVSILSVAVQAIVLFTALLFGVTALAVGLFLVPKKINVTFFKRMTVVGVIAPLGILLTVGWVGFPVWACLYSISYFVPSMFAIAAATMGLRFLGQWVCKTDSESAKNAVEATH
ncbi:MAG: hypothetical protein AAF802_22135 [Planctomycetota bacterium]